MSLCLQGPFGAGKTSRLVSECVGVLSADGTVRVLLVCPTLRHAAQIRDRLQRVHALSDHVLKRLIIAHGSELAARLNSSREQAQVFVDTFVLVCVDDADFSGGFKWSMKTVVRQLIAARPARIFLTCRSSTQLPPLSSSMKTNTLATSLRMQANQHGPFLRLLFPASCSSSSKAMMDKDSHPRLPAFVPCTNGREEMALLALGQVTQGNTCVVCDSDFIRDALLRQVPAWNESRRAQGLPVLPWVQIPKNSSAHFPSSGVQLACTGDVFGLEFAHVVLVLADAAVSDDALVEGCTRHTKTLAIVFSARAPPPRLAQLRQTAELDSFVDWSSRKRPRVEIKDVTVREFAAGHTLESLVLLLTGVEKFTCITHVKGTVAQHQNNSPLLAAAAKKEPAFWRTLGKIVEAVVVVCGFDVPLASTEVGQILQKQGIVAVHGGEEEEPWLWIRAMVPTTPLTEDELLEMANTLHYFRDVRARTQRLCSFIQTTSAAQVQQATLLQLADGSRVSGSADAVFPGCGVLEVKNMSGCLDDAAKVQAAVYAISLNVPRAFLFNAVSGEVLEIGVVMQHES